MIMKVDLSKVKKVKMGDVKMFDYPEFCDAFVEYAEIDGRELTDEEYDYINNNEFEFLNEKAHESLYEW